NPERRAQALAGALGANAAAVQFHEVADDREAEAQSAILPAGSDVGLAEPLEHVRDELRMNADAGIADHDLDIASVAAHREIDHAVSRRELDRVREQVPDDL